MAHSFVLGLPSSHCPVSLYFIWQEVWTEGGEIKVNEIHGAPVGVNVVVKTRIDCPDVIFHSNPSNQLLLLRLVFTLDGRPRAKRVGPGCLTGARWPFRFVRYDGCGACAAQLREKPPEKNISRKRGHQRGLSATSSSCSFNLPHPFVLTEIKRDGDGRRREKKWATRPFKAVSVTSSIASLPDSITHSLPLSSAAPWTGEEKRKKTVLYKVYGRLPAN